MKSISYPSDIRAAAEAAVAANHRYLTDGLEQYHLRQAQRQRRELPTLVFCGPGRAGKDEAGEFLARTFEVRFCGSTSKLLCPLVATSLGLAEEECFQRRHEDRLYWKEFANCVRYQDATLLAKLALGQGDILVGLRALPEIRACQEQNVGQLFIWVHRPGLPADLTLDYDDRECDIQITNDQDLPTYYRRLFRFAMTTNLKSWRKRPHE